MTETRPFKNSNLFSNHYLETYMFQCKEMSRNSCDEKDMEKMRCQFQSFWIPGSRRIFSRASGQLIIFR